MEDYFIRNDFDADPVVQFNRWYAEAQQSNIELPHSMTLATATRDGRPAARMVLLKDADARGFTFFTSYSSHKARQLADNPFAALVFYWDILHRQVRIEGRVKKVTAEESTAYFKIRPRGTQLGAWASQQSEVIENRQVLEERVRKLEEKYENENIPRPPVWGGYRIVPEHIEFWAGRPSRLHDRFLYTRQDDGIWTLSQLAP